MRFLPGPARLLKGDSLRRPRRTSRSTYVPAYITVAPEGPGLDHRRCEVALRQPVTGSRLRASIRAGRVFCMVTLEGEESAREFRAGRQSRYPLRILDLNVMASITEITVLGGECYRVEGEAKAVERLILDAARGSIMQFAWFTDTKTGDSLAINPECVVMLRAAGT
jgi:hypothetical protein